jgi:hypothetical protein
MKKIIVLLVVILLLTGCNKDAKIVKKIELSNSGCTIDIEEDTHSGFHNDGDYYARIKCTDIDYDKLQAHFKLDGFGEEFIIQLVSTEQIAIYSGLHGCLDITPTVFKLINEGDYEVYELGRLIDGKIEGVWYCHGIMNCGLWLDYEGSNHWIVETNYIEVE